MIASITLGVADIDDAMTFYRQFMEVLGWDEKFATRRNPPGPWAGWHPLGADKPLFIISHPSNPNAPVPPGGGAQVTFEVASPEIVDAAHAEALDLGGTSVRAPGEGYPATDYTACVRDPFANTLCIVSHGALGRALPAPATRTNLLPLRPWHSAPAVAKWPPNA